MTARGADAEARVLTAVQELGEALIALAREQAATAPEPGPVELYSPARFAAMAGLGRSTVYLAIADGSVRSTRVRGRRLIPSTELGRLAAAAPPPVSKKKAVTAVGTPVTAMSEGHDNDRPAA